MELTIIALLIPVIISIISTVNEEKTPKTRKIILILLTVSGLGLGIWSAIKENEEKVTAMQDRQRSEQLLEESNQKLSMVQDSLSDSRKIISTVSLTTNDLAVLNKLTGAKTYRVIIAQGNTRQELEVFKKRIENMFDGAEKSGLVSVEQPKKGGKFELLFGRNLSVAAAEVFHRLAITHRFSNGFPIIRKEKVNDE